MKTLNDIARRVAELTRSLADQLAPQTAPVAVRVEAPVRRDVYLRRRGRRD